jgi:hypothetical protein
MAAVAQDAPNKQDEFEWLAESRIRYESRNGMNFGREVDTSTAILRQRLGLTWRPSEWVKISAMAQDCRAPLYGRPAPASLRDPLDLQEGYAEIHYPGSEGMEFSGGRRMISYGDARLIGSPQWANTTRTWDHARVSWRTPKARIDGLFLSPVDVNLNGFNRPRMDRRLWGVYTMVPALKKGLAGEFYILRHDQGFAGALRTNSFGGRLVGKSDSGWGFEAEGVLQNGEAGAKSHRGHGFFTSVNRRLQADDRPLTLVGEYKHASGTEDPSNASRSTTFDQLYPANHDKFGHEDLLGWRNIHNMRAQAGYGVHKLLTLTLMYDDSWLASPKDAMYNLGGAPIARDPLGRSGRHIGREVDLFATVKLKKVTFGAGYGRFFAGEFVKKTTPGVGPDLFYIYQDIHF